MLVFQHVDILSQLFESELRLGFAVRMVKDFTTRHFSKVGIFHLTY